MIQTIHIRCTCGHQAPAEEFIQAGDKYWHCRSCGTAFRAARRDERANPEYIGNTDPYSSAGGVLVRHQMEMTI